VNYNALFLVGVLLIPFLMFLIPGRRKVIPEPSSVAEQRLLHFEQRRQNLWRAGAAVLSIVIVLFIAFDFVYGQSKKKISTPQPVSGVQGEIRIPVETVSDGNLHRFVYSDTPIRFLVMKLEEGLIATAFDACEICGSQGYVQEAGSVICLNCAADINPATFAKGGGCNPIPLESRVEGDMLIIRVEDVKKKESHFGEVH
jgi:uncharacterized membrane protein